MKTIKCISCRFAQVDEKAGDKSWTAYECSNPESDYYKAFGSNLLEKGASLVSIQKLLGHSDLRVTSRYLHQDIDKLSEAVNLL